jgi:hypothetical protein
LSFTANWGLDYLYWIIVALGVIIAVVAAVALAKN